MSLQSPPKIDNRSARDIFREAAGYLEKDLKIDAVRGDPAAEALLRVFARYCELIIQRLNRVPDKNQAAFLDMLNIARIPPVAAQAFLTFTPVKHLPGEPGSIWVPGRNQVAADPAEGETEPIVFETTRDVVLTNLELKKILALDPTADLCADKSYLGDPEQGGAGEFLFDVNQLVVHEFYLGHAPIFAEAGITTLHLYLKVEGSSTATSDRPGVDWFIPSEDGHIPLNPDRDDTAGLTQSGEVVFTNLPQWPQHEVFSSKTHWLGCRLRDRSQTRKSVVIEKAAEPPVIRAIMIGAAWRAAEIMVEAAMYNAMPLDISKDFFPFGERPRFGDVFYLKCEALARAQAGAAIKINLTNPASEREDTPIPAVYSEGAPVIQWECWNGQRWLELACQDRTKAFIQNGEISFLDPLSILPTVVNGLEGHWIRAILIAGNYGEAERLEPADPDQTLRLIPATLAPPAIHSITVSKELKAGPEPPQQIVTNNDLYFRQVHSQASFQPFQAASRPERALYLGFNFPKGQDQKLAALAVDLYCHMRGVVGRAFVRESSQPHLPELTWQYWNGSDWSEVDIEDETESLTQSGTLCLRTGDDIELWKAFSVTKEPCYWVRALWTAGTFECPPKICRILLNTVAAIQATTIENEVLGSSNGRPGQIFRSARRPILDKIQVEVREPDIPSDDDYPLNSEQDHWDGVDLKWIRWLEVKNFLASTNRDRHFVVDRPAGEIRFGNGIQGLIPPVAANNIRLSTYQTGGGEGGNKPAGAITQLRTSVAYVSSVTNLEAAFGGQNEEDWDDMRERGSRFLRHRGRAVTREDYEDLAKRATPLVAKAKCYPNFDLAQDPTGGPAIPGVVSLVIVPHSRDPKPLPGLTLLHQVAKYLRGCRSADSELILLAPEYVQIRVEAVIVAAGADTGAAAVARCKQEIGRYLHPLRGGKEGKGWEFGRRPHKSDLYACLEAIPMVGYVHSLNLRLVEERPGLLQSNKYLVYNGEHEIQLRM